MGKVYLEQIDGIPRYVCTDCSRCSSVMGRSLHAVQNRGCCSYFPEFQLIDIQTLCKTPEGLKTLDAILQLPGTVVYPYHIHARGHFDREGYEKYLKGSPMPGAEKINDHTVFFRACPFVNPDIGCSLPPKFRNYICNFFICEEILGTNEEEGPFKIYLEERSRYARWIYRENLTLQHILTENGVTLKHPMKQALELLYEIPSDVYEFPPLEPVETP